MSKDVASPAAAAAAPAAAAPAAVDPAVTELATRILEDKERAAAAGPPSWRGKLVAAVHKVGPFLSFGPMVAFACVPDVRVGAVVGFAIAVFNALLTALLWRLRVFRVFPRVFDLVNVAIYATLLAVAETHPRWTTLWAPLFTSGLTAIYFAGSLVVGRPFTHELAKESAPEFFWDNAAFKRLNTHISLAWAIGLWVVTLAAVAFGLIYRARGPSPTAYLLLDVVLGIAPLVLAVVAQHVLVWRFRRGVRAEAVRLAQLRGGGGAGATGEQAV